MFDIFKEKHLCCDSQYIEWNYADKVGHGYRYVGDCLSCAAKFEKLVIKGKEKIPIVERIEWFVLLPVAFLLFVITATYLNI